jgi:hypothetical protein
MKALALSLLLASGGLLVSPSVLAETKHAESSAEQDLGSSGNAPVEAADDAASQSEPAPGVEVGNHAGPDGAYEPTQPFDKAARDRKPETFGHAGQVGVRAAITFAYKVNFRADDSPGCDDGTISVATPEKKVCPVGTPPAIDLALSYAVLDALELFVWARLGLGQEAVTHTAASRIFGAGLRIYTMPDQRFKLFLEPAVAFEVEGSTDATTNRNYDVDLLAHLHIGGQFDFAKAIGAYVSVGPEAAFVRGISVAMGGTIGVQARFP